MKIDLREIPVYWINLDSAIKNAERMTKMFEKLGFKNTVRKSARVIPAPPDTIPSNKHYVGCAQSHIDIFEIADLKTPFLILEDDVEVIEENFNPVLEIPDETAALYLGISTGNMFYNCIKYNKNYKRIAGILATHAILYTSQRYREEVKNMSKDLVYNRRTPFDIGCAYLQKFFQVLTPNKPVFYQADLAESSNKWEHLTKCELEVKG
jgi:hypothetical protein